MKWPRSVFRFFTEEMSVGFGRFFAAVGCKTKPTEKNKWDLRFRFGGGNRKSDPIKLGFGFLRKPTEKPTGVRFFGFRFSALNTAHNTY